MLMPTGNMFSASRSYNTSKSSNASISFNVNKSSSVNKFLDGKRGEVGDKSWFLFVTTDKNILKVVNQFNNK